MKPTRPRLLTYKRIVIKIGTSSLMNPDGTIDYQKFDRLAYVLSGLKN